MNLTDLKKYSPAKLIEMAAPFQIKHFAGLHKTDMILALLKAHAENGEEISASGVLEIIKGNYGFLRSVEDSYLAGPVDIYVSPKQISRFNLRTGDTVYGKIRPPKEGEHYFALLKVNAINFEDVDAIDDKKRLLFENFTPIYPNYHLKLERGDGSAGDITARVIDLIAPIGKGQRALIDAPPKVGKTELLRTIVHSITQNYKECYIIVLLIGERPEEVTDMRRSVKGEVVASTFDEPPNRHIQVAEMTIEKAKRLVEHQYDVVLLLDSITRLARAYNMVMPSSGKVLTGGVEVSALIPPKRFFGSARNHEEGGSLTIIATALTDTGSKADDVIYQEIKGTGNMEVHLDRGIAQKSIYPAVSIRGSSARRPDLLVKQDALQKMHILRKILGSMDEENAIEFLLDRLRSTKTNMEFFESMKNKREE
jgi:transcription termination factor Rho